MINPNRSLERKDDKYDVFIGCLDILPIAFGEIVIVFLFGLLLTESDNESDRNNGRLRRT